MKPLKGVPTRIDREFEKLLREMARKKIEVGTDNVMRSPRRLTKAIRRHPKFKDIKKDIILADLKGE